MFPRKTREVGRWHRQPLVFAGICAFLNLAFWHLRGGCEVPVLGCEVCQNTCEVGLFSDLFDGLQPGQKAARFLGRDVAEPVLIALAKPA